MNVVAASYYKLGNVRNAKEFLKMATETNSKNDYDSHVTNAILSKIYFDKQDYTNALILSEDAAKTGKVPLAAYVYGASLIKQTIIQILVSNGCILPLSIIIQELLRSTVLKMR